MQDTLRTEFMGSNCELHAAKKKWRNSIEQTAMRFFDQLSGF